MKYFILTIITLFMIGCKSKKATTSDSSTGNLAEESAKEVIYDMNFQTPKDNANFEIINASIEGDILTLEVSYSGGCQEHEFNAYFNGIYMKSLPPKAGIFIHHIDNDDNCRSVETKTLKFNLNEVKSPGNKSDYTIMLGMNNYDGYLEYKY